jgi:hypothetical protein
VNHFVSYSCEKLTDDEIEKKLLRGIKDCRIIDTFNTRIDREPSYANGVMSTQN